MTGKLCRSVSVIVLGGLAGLCPVWRVYGQNATPTTGQTPGQAPAAGQTVTVSPTAPLATPGAGQTPGQAPSADQTPTPPPATPAPPPPPRTLTVTAVPGFTQPKSIAPRFWLPYTQIQLPEPQYVNSPKVQQLVQNGKMLLSLEDCIELALENNPDIAVQRYNSWIADIDVVRTKGGGAQRGVPGAVTTATAFTDQPALSFDPIFSANASIDSRSVLSNTSGGSSGATTLGQELSTHTGTMDFGYSQSFHEGTTWGVSFLNARESTTGADFYNPFVQSSATISFNQPFLNGFGLLVNERYIRVAKITKRAVDAAFEQSVITDLVAVMNDYWELVFARGNVAVQQESVTLAQQLYDNNQAQVAVGTLAPLEIVRAEAQLASAQQALILAQTAQQQDQIILMNVIAKNPIASELQNVEVVTTDTAVPPPPVEDITLNDAVAEAIQDRPDVLGFKINLDADAVNIKATRNALLPSLNLSGYLTTSGLAGNNNVVTVVPGPGEAIETANGTGCSAAAPCPVTVANLSSLPPGQAVGLILPNTVSNITGVTKGGLGTALDQVFTGKYPEYFAQLGLTVPIRNRVAQADSARAILAERQDQAKYQEEINATAVDVQNALITLRQDRATVIAAQKTTELQRETLDADEKRLQVGATTVFVVVTDQSNLEAAAAAEVRAGVNLSEALVNFDRALGRIFSAHNITLANAKVGSSPRDTLIPGTASNGDLIGLKEAFTSLPNGPK